MKTSGIYKIVNKVNGKYYVGSSKDITSNVGRFYQHQKMLKRGNHHCSHLQYAYKKYGENNFTYVIVEQTEATEEALLSLEQKYLNVAKKEKHKCYNSSFIAGRIEMTAEVRKKLSEAGKGRIPKTAITGHSKETIEKIRKSLMGKPSGARGKRWKCPACSKRCSGSGNPNADKNIYTFINVMTNETFTGYKVDFVNKYKLPPWYPYGIINQGKTKKNWKLVTS